MTAGNGMIIAFATSPNTSALGSESPDGNGCYTKRLLEHIDHPNMKVEDMFKLVRKDVIKDTAGQQVPWENTSLNGNFYFCTMAQDEINEVIYQSIRNYHCAEMLINLSKRFGYTVSDVMRIYERQKSEKVGGIRIVDEKEFESYILKQILDLGFEFINYRWVYRKTPVLMGDFQHDYTKAL